MPPCTTTSRMVSPSRLTYTVKLSPHSGFTSSKAASGASRLP